MRQGGNARGGMREGGTGRERIREEGRNARGREGG